MSLTMKPTGCSEKQLEMKQFPNKEEQTMKQMQSELRSIKEHFLKQYLQVILRKEAF